MKSWADIDPTRTQSQYDGKEPEPRLPNYTELVVLGMLLFWLLCIII